jgi:two-component sensor histidine kinase
MDATILIVDDEPTNLEALRTLLSPLYKIIVAKSGERALALAQAQPQPDLILLDIMIPGMNGFTVLSHLQSSPETRSIPVIFVTSLGDSHDERVGLELGAVDYITKPVNPAVVLARVKTQLEVKLTRDRLENQKDALLHEVYHRVGNNLNVISSLLSLQVGWIKTPEDAFAAFERARDRILAMAAVHQELYESPDHGRIVMREFVQRLCARLIGSVPGGSGLKSDFHIDDILLRIDTAVPCGMILNELFGNAVRHAFSDRDGGLVRITLLRKTGGTIVMTVEDNGNGIPEGAENGGSLGFLLVDLFVSQINGSFEIQRSGSSGTVCRVVFPDC